MGQRPLMCAPPTVMRHPSQQSSISLSESYVYFLLTFKNRRTQSSDRSKYLFCLRSCRIEFGMLTSMLQQRFISGTSSFQEIQSKVNLEENAVLGLD